MKYILTLFLFISTVSLSFSQNQKELIVKNNTNGKKRYFDENQLIKVWTKDQVYKGRFTIKNDSTIVIDDKTIALKDITEFRGRTKMALATGITVMSIPTLFTSGMTLYAYNGGDLGHIIMAAVGFTVGVATVPVGVLLITSTKKECGNENKFSIFIE